MVRMILTRQGTCHIYRNGGYQDDMSLGNRTNHKKQLERVKKAVSQLFKKGKK